MSVSGQCALRKDGNSGKVANEFMNSIRILFTVHSFACGGLERIVVQLVNRLDRTCFTPVIACLTRSGEAASWLGDDTVKVIELHKKAGNDLGACFRLAKIIQRERIQLVQSHNWGTLGEAVTACLLARVPLIHTQHGFEYDALSAVSWRVSARKLAMRQLLRIPKTIVPIAQSVEAWLESDFRVVPERTRMIPNGVEPPPGLKGLLPRSPSSLDITLDRVVFGAVGRLVPLKEYSLAIRALAHAVTQSMNLHLVIIGDGPQREELRRLATELGVADRVHLPGYQQNIWPWLKAMDIYVNCSRTEAMSIGVLEAMAVGLPCIVTAVGDNEHLVTGGDTPAGIVVPSGDYGALASAMVNLGENEVKRRWLGKNARNRARSSFSIVKMVQAYERLYSDTVKNTSRSDVACL